MSAPLKSIFFFWTTLMLLTGAFSGKKGFRNISFERRYDSTFNYAYLGGVSWMNPISL